MPGICEFAVNLVGNHKHVVTEANLADALQLRTCPHPSNGVVRVAEKKHAGLGCLGLEIFPVYAPAAVFIMKRAVQLHALVVPYCREKRVVAGREHYYLVSGNGHGLDCGRVGSYYSGCRNHGLTGNPLPAMARREPLVLYRKVVVRNKFVSKDAVVKPFLQGLEYSRSGLEVHVGHPHGQHAALT